MQDHEDIDVGDMNNQTVALPTGSLRLEARDPRLRLLKRAVNGLIYASVLLGIAVLAQLYALMVPSWLFYSILVGWVLYLFVAVAVAAGREKAYSCPCSLHRNSGCLPPATRTLLSRRRWPKAGLADLHFRVTPTDRSNSPHHFFLILRRRVLRARVISVRQ
jgi:hypothetical protein